MFEVVAVVAMEALVVVDSDSCAPTEIDPESVHSCSDSDINDADKGDSEAKHRRVSVDDTDDTTTLRFWRNLTNMAHHIYMVDRHPEITWHLPEPAEADFAMHGTRHIRAILKMGVRAFKIGITCHPAHRWSNRRYGYQHGIYSEMHVIYVSESSDKVAAMEKALIRIYRHVDRSGKYVGNPGHPLCRNRAPGGEKAHVGYSPFFVYVVFQLRWLQTAGTRARSLRD